MEGIFVGIILLVGMVTGVVSNEVSIAKQKQLEAAQEKQIIEKEKTHGTEINKE